MPRSIETIPEYQKYVCLVFDEVKIKEDLVYDKHSAEVVSFVNVGDVNNQLLQFERTCKSDSSAQPHLATHLLTFMVRGVLSNLEFPYAQFASSSITADQLYSLVWGYYSRLPVPLKAHAISLFFGGSNWRWLAIRFRV